MTHPDIRNATSEDLPRIVEIYNASIPGRLATADTSPVTVESRVAWFDAHGPGKHPLWVLERDEGIVAWISTRPFYGRPAYHSTAEVSIYVANEAQGQGLGKVLLDQLMAECPAMGLKTLLAFVFGHNTPSIRLFESRGFTSWGHLPEVAELDGNWRDLAILGRKI